MKVACKRIQALALAALLAACSSAVNAIVENVRFFNDTELDYGFFCSDDPVNLEFLNLTFGDQMNAWNVELLTPSTLIFLVPPHSPFAVA